MNPPSPRSLICEPSLRIMLVSALILSAGPAVFSQRLPLPPHLRAGETFFYQIDCNSTRGASTDSRVVSADSPTPQKFNISALVQVEVEEASSSGIRLKTYYSERDMTSSAASASAPDSRTPDKLVEVTLSPDGSSSRLKGLDQLSPERQFVWNSWLARFASQLTFPKGVRIAQKWQSSERESGASPIANLVWNRKYQYVRDESCGPTQTSGKCAVIFVRAALQQKSSAKNSTPEDYKLRNLKTAGTASGENETILYFSIATGLLVRSTEDASQSMDAVVALADGSNEVHYRINAKSHTEIRLLPDAVSPASH